jgi:hypothetical protein
VGIAPRHHQQIALQSGLNVMRIAPAKHTAYQQTQLVLAKSAATAMVQACNACQVMARVLDTALLAFARTQMEPLPPS